jgi:hypothetical protein
MPECAERTLFPSSMEEQQWPIGPLTKVESVISLGLGHGFSALDPIQ